MRPDNICLYDSSLRLIFNSHIISNLTFIFSSYIIIKPINTPLKKQQLFI